MRNRHKKPNYLTDILTAYQKDPTVFKPGVLDVMVYHDDACAFFNGGSCNCKPEVVQVVKKVNHAPTNSD